MIIAIQVLTTTVKFEPAIAPELFYCHHSVQAMKSLVTVIYLLQEVSMNEGGPLDHIGQQLTTWWADTVLLASAPMATSHYAMVNICTKHSTVE
jgi:hypothetical protein